MTAGTLWGGNLAIVAHLCGTPHFPSVEGGILFLEDVGETPYRIERMIYQLHHAGVLARQRAILLGQFTEYVLSANDGGYDMDTAVAHVRSVCRTPVFTGLPFGHVPDKLTLPVGGRCDLMVRDGARDACVLRLCRLNPRRGSPSATSHGRRKRRSFARCAWRCSSSSRTFPKSSNGTSTTR